MIARDRSRMHASARGRARGRYTNVRMHVIVCDAYMSVT